MTTKIPLLFAIIALLPLNTWAAYTYVTQNTPARVRANGGTVTRAASRGPYATVTINDDDDKHIASTAYVKGAYNDTIAGLNQKQGILIVEDDEGIMRDIQDEIYSSLEAVDAENQLVNGMAVKNAIDDVNTTISDQRVIIYTTWDDDSANATTQVALSTAQ